MRLLDRYLLRELLLPLAYCLGGFLISFIAFDLFSSLSDLQRDGLTAGEVLRYYLYRTPEFLVTSYIAPLSLLLAMLYALTNHSRHNEITAMRAAAIPLWRIAAPYFAVGLAFSLTVFYVNEKLLPEGMDAAERLRRSHRGDLLRSRDKVWRLNFFFVNTAANRSWRIGAFHLQGGAMFQPHFDWRRPDGTRLQVHAERARWVNRQWVFTNVQQLTYGPEVGALPEIIKTNSLVVPELTETPRSIRSEIKISALNQDFRSLRRVQLSSGEILDYLELHPKLTRKQSNPLYTLLHKQLAAPWICLVVVFIAVPFGAIPGRRNVFVGVASSVFICFLFLILKDFTLALGSRGWVAPILAAWLPNLLFMATGVVLMWRVR